MHILPTKARIKYMICMPAHKALPCREPLYLNEMLELKESSTTNLWSNQDTQKLVEHKVPGPGFTNRSSKYCTRYSYNTLPKAIRQLENIGTSKKRLKTDNFCGNFEFESNTIRDGFVT